MYPCATYGILNVSMRWSALDYKVITTPVMEDARELVNRGG
jgi:hypothetical protein